MSAPALAFVPLAGDATGALQKVPTGPGVGQIVAAEGRSLVVGVASSLRRWAASQLGLAKKPAVGRSRRRPRRLRRSQHREAESRRREPGRARIHAHRQTS